MSKIGQKAIPVPTSVQVDVKDYTVRVKGSKGELSIEYPKFLTIEKTGDTLLIKNASASTVARASHGLFRSLIANAVAGVETPWTKKLELVGTGYNVKMQGTDLALKVGYSHVVLFKKVEGVSYQVDGNTKIIVSGIDKQLVGQIAYQIKLIKKPDVYKGKGIRYEGEVVRIKPGKKAKTASA